MNTTEPFADVIVVGVKFDNRQAVVRSLRTGQQLLLRRDLNNPGGRSNAIRVDTPDGRSVGYLSQEMADNLAVRFDSRGAPVIAVVSRIVGGTAAAPDYGVRINFELPREEILASVVKHDVLLDNSYSILTHEQRLIVRHPLGSHARVMAVAGSGKTTTMVYRIKYLVESCGVQPSRICVLMFNHRARDQFKEKLNEVVSEPSLRPYNVHTFHSFCYMVLSDAGTAGLKFDPEEDATGDKKETAEKQMKQAINRLEDRKEIPPNSVTMEDAMDCVGLWKGALIPPSRAGHRGNPVFMPKVYAEFEKAREAEHMLTFDDYVPETIRLLQIDSTIGRKYRNRFQVIIVDEYQDVNYGQQKLVELLAGDRADVMVVGDDDQTIYEWRGARPDYLAQRFENLFPKRPSPGDYHLTNTFRFGPILAQCAHNVIINNHSRISKALIAFDAKQESTVFIDEDVSEQPTDNDKALANAVATWIEQGVKPTQIVVLGRLYAQFAGLESEFLKQKIAYRVHGRKPFLERKEIVALLNYLRLAGTYERQITPQSAKWLNYIANTPNRRLTRETYLKVADSMPTSTVAEVMTAVAEDKWKTRLSDEQRRKAADFRDTIRELHDRMQEDESVPVFKLLHWVVEQTEYTKHYDNFYGDGINSEERKDAVSAFLYFARQGERTTPEFFRYLATLNPSQKKPLEEQVMMTSIFRVKGEEFDYVILPGCINGNLPCLRPDDNPIFDTEGIVAEPPRSDDLDNERRLFYVAVTRAKKAVLITTSVPPRLGQQGASHVTQASCFLGEMQHGATKEVMGELQRCASAGFTDLSKLSAVAIKRAANEQIVSSLLDGYLARNNLALPEEVQKRIRATPKIPFQSRCQDGSKKGMSLTKQTPLLPSNDPGWWDE